MRGFGGERLAAAGVRLDHDLAAEAVMGVTAVLRAAPRFVSLYARFLRLLDEERPDALLLVDYPGFNLRAAEAARRRGIPVVWFVVPQIWAWAPWRARRIGRATTDLCVVLPFERAFYHDRGVAARFVGYPLFEDRGREAPDGALLRRLRGPGGPVLAVLPGSRRQEGAKNLAAMLGAVRLLRDRVPDLRPVIACASPRLRASIDEAVARSGIPVEVLDGNAGTLLAAARAALCVSGTITMECVHAGVPAVVAYQVSAAGRAFMPLLLTVPRFALANLLAGSAVYPEHADPAGDAAAIAAELEGLLADGPAREGVVAALRALRGRLEVAGTYERVSSVIEARLPVAPR